jgi:hypothetical protein
MGHGQDELMNNIFGNSASANGSRFPTPEPHRAFRAATGSGLRSNHDQRSLPIEQSRQSDHREMRDIGGALRLNSTRLEETAQKSDEVQSEDERRMG